MNMKLTKKDKIMLGVLAVVIFVAVFFVYGIMPNNEKSKELDATIATKQTAVDELQQRLAALAGAQIDYKFDKALDFYFDNNEDSSLHPIMDKIAIEKMMRDIFDEYKLVGYSTVGWATTPNEYTNSYDDISATNNYYVAGIQVSYKIEKESDFRAMIDRFNSDPNFRVVNYSMKEEEKPEEPETPPTPPDPADPPVEPETFYELSGTLNLQFFMGDKYRSELLPKALPEPDEMMSINGDVTFTKVANAVTYEVYSVTIDEAGKRTFTLLPDIKPVEKEGKMTFSVTAKEFPSNTGNIAIRAIGDKKDYYKTKWSDMDTLSITIA